MIVDSPSEWPFDCRSKPPNQIRIKRMAKTKADAEEGGPVEGATSYGESCLLRDLLYMLKLNLGLRQLFRGIMLWGVATGAPHMNVTIAAQLSNVE